MKMLLAQFHEKYLLAKPLLSLFFIFLLTAISAWYVQDFKLDIRSEERRVGERV